MTANGGQYAFAGLAEGTYVLSMMNPNETAYNFETMSATIVLGDAESNITNFEGTHTRTASVSGVLFIDEAPADGCTRPTSRCSPKRRLSRLRCRARA